MPSLSPNQIERYKRQILVPELGAQGQTALLSRHIGIIGGGALGGIVAQYLCAAGLGTLTIFDDDMVDLSNLQRQIHFTTPDIGQAKSEILAQGLNRLNPDIRIHARRERFGTNSTLSCDLVIDCTDNFEARFAINDFSRKSHTPMLSGAVGRWDGQVGFFNTDANMPCYRCWVSEPPIGATDCINDGVLGPICGLVASIMALEGVKYCAGLSSSLPGNILVISGRDLSFRHLKLRPDPQCLVCGQIPT